MILTHLSNLKCVNVRKLLFFHNTLYVFACIKAIGFGLDHRVNVFLFNVVIHAGPFDLYNEHQNPCSKITLATEWRFHPDRK